ncbi:MAG: hypothetical protein CSA72_05035 [Rhodobacterales bacterium]|nr:MAG: hypothetical protein CSA72_05035 [Rhodobacterales bacterium]
MGAGGFFVTAPKSAARARSVLGGQHTGQPMTQPIETRDAQEQTELEQARLLFTHISSTLHAVLQEVRSGDLTHLDQLTKKQLQLEEVANRAAKLKEQFDAKHDTGLRDGEFDLDRARFEIGCKLARLRACCDAGRLSCELERE